LGHEIVSGSLQVHETVLVAAVHLVLDHSLQTALVQVMLTPVGLAVAEVDLEVEEELGGLVDLVKRSERVLVEVVEDLVASRLQIVALETRRVQVSQFML